MKCAYNDIIWREHLREFIGTWTVAYRPIVKAKLLLVLDERQRSAERISQAVRVCDMCVPCVSFSENLRI